MYRDPLARPVPTSCDARSITDGERSGPCHTQASLSGAVCVCTDRILLAAKRNYYTDKIASCGSNQKHLCDITKSLMGISSHAKLPSDYLQQRFRNHFEKNVSDIRHSIAHRRIDRSYAIAAAFSVESAFRSAQLTRFTGVNDSEVSEVD